VLVGKDKFSIVACDENEEDPTCSSEFSFDEDSDWEFNGQLEVA